MKLSIIFLGVIFSLSSFAGMPDQDPVVAKLRSDFSKAGVPTPADLRIGYRIYCNIFSAEPNDFSHNTSWKFRFTTVDGIYMNEEVSSVTAFVLKPTVGLVGGVFSGNQYYEVVRVTPNGDLIVELLAQLNNAKFATSVIDSTYNALTYSICPKGNPLE